MTSVSEQTDRHAAIEQLRMALGELFGAERRLRGREQGRGLTTSQLRALFILGKTDEVTAGDLAKSADLNPASVTAMLDQLESNGIVARRRSAHDRRMCMVSLTEKGHEVVNEQRARWVGQWEEHLQGRSEQELLTALHVMQLITQLLDAL